MKNRKLSTNGDAYNLSFKRAINTIEKRNSKSSDVNVTKTVIKSIGEPWLTDNLTEALIS